MRSIPEDLGFKVSGVRMWLLTLAIVCLLPASSRAVTYYAPSNAPPLVNLAWDASPTTNSGPVAYKVYYGVSSRAYTNVISAETNLTLTVRNLERGVTYYFACTAMLTNGLESDFSNEVQYQVPSPPASPGLHPPIILVVESAPTPKGAWADAGMNWTLSPQSAQEYFRLRLAKAFVVPAVAPSLLSFPNPSFPPLPPEP